jgi:hypothetical protein
MNIDWKLYRTLVVAGLTLIVFNSLISNWDSFKAGLSGGYAASKAAATKP